MKLEIDLPDSIYREAQGYAEAHKMTVERWLARQLVKLFEGQGKPLTDDKMLGYPQKKESVTTGQNNPLQDISI